MRADRGGDGDDIGVCVRVCWLGRELGTRCVLGLCVCVCVWVCVRRARITKPNHPIACHAAQTAVWHAMAVGFRPSLVCWRPIPWETPSASPAVAPVNPPAARLLVLLGLRLVQRSVWSHAA